MRLAVLWLLAFPCYVVGSVVGFTADSLWYALEAGFIVAGDFIRGPVKDAA